MNEEQVVRMKELSLKDYYSNNGELYKFLDLERVQELIKQIPDEKIQIDYDVIFKRKFITKEEKFLEILDQYITYVKNNYFLNNQEQRLLIEESLKNDYVSILLSLEDPYTKYEDFIKEFKKLFFYNFYSNIKLFSKSVPKGSSLYILYDDIKDFNYDKHIDILETLFREIIKIRKNNLFNSFIYTDEIDNKSYDFYMQQVNWVIDDYLNDMNNVRQFDSRYEKSKNCIIVNKDTKLLFHILNNFNKTKKNKPLHIDFGIKNKYFSALISEELFTKEELLEFLDLIDKTTEKNKFEQEYQIVNSRLKFNFWSDNDIHCLEIYFRFDERNVDYYVLDLELNDLIQLKECINSQIYKN